jgi:hypothetical protein
MLSLGPTIQGEHTPAEKLHLPSLDRTWTFLTALLTRWRRNREKKPKRMLFLHKFALFALLYRSGYLIREKEYSMSIYNAKQEVDSKEKSRALEATILQIEKQHGKGSIMRLGADNLEPLPAISTGSISWIWRSGSAASPKAGSPRSTGRNPR